MTALLDAIQRHAAQHPDAIAIDGAAKGSISWANLAQRIVVARNALADEFSQGQPVIALAVDHGPTACLADLALIEAGLAALPIPSFFTSDQRRHALATAGTQAIISDAEADFPARDSLFSLLFLGDAAAVALPPRTAKISFTSGSTGTPKGICLSADHMLEVAQAVVDTLGTHHAGRHLALLPPGILLENVAGFYAVMLAGGTYVALPLAETGFANPFRPDFALLLKIVAEQAITSLILVPEYLNGLVTAMELSGVRLPLLTLVAVGGARISADFLARATHRTSLSPSTSLSWTPDRNRIVYLRFASAYRPSGLSPFVPLAASKFESDELQSFELGGRYSNAARNLDLGATAYLANWSHIQSDYLLSNGLIATRNTGTGQIYGLQTHIRQAFGRLSLEAGLVLQHARLEAPEPGLVLATENRLPIVPGVKGHLTAKYAIPARSGAFDLTGQLTYIGATKLSLDPALNRRIGARATLDLDVRRAWNDWTLSFGATNLLDSHRNSFGFGNPFSVSALPQSTPIRPRTLYFGISRSWR